MFNSQDSIDFGQAGMNSIGYPQESASPVRKKGRSKHHSALQSSSKSDTANPFLFSQDSMMASQYSQNFTDRMGQLHMFCSQDNSNSESTFSVPFLQQANLANATTENTFLNSRSASLHQQTSFTKQTISSTSAAFETERPIDIPAPVRNVFLSGVKPHHELYCDPTGNYGESAAKKAKRPTKVWIGAFQERPRIVTEFEELRILGEGTFSTVTCVRHRLDGTLYAVKRIKESIVSERQSLTLLREVSALSVLQGCPQIVKYYSSWVDNHHLFIQTELCHLGSLEDIISPAPSHSSVLYTASVAKKCIVSGGVPTTLKAEVNADRNRSESFNSIDINDASLLYDECLTAPGPPVNSTSFMPPMPPAFGTAVQQSSGGSSGGVRDNVHNNAYSNIQSNVQDSNMQVSASNSMIRGDSVGNHSVGNSDVYFTQTQQSQSNQMIDDSVVKRRGVCEDLAWLVLYDVSCALRYMHDRDMVHLDLRPANIFLTTSPSYREMCPSDPQRLVQMSQVPIVAPVSASFSLFSNILNAAPLYTHGSATTANGATAKASTVNHSTTASNTNTVPVDSSASASASAALLDEAYNIRAEVERLLVHRKYMIKVGDLGHCCRVDEKNAIQEGQTRYCARELINMEEESLDARKADIFSLGASVYEMCLGRFLGAEGEEGIAEWHSIRDGHLDSAALAGFSKSLVDTLHLLMHPDPTHRPSAQFLATHLYAHYPDQGTKKSVIFDTHSEGLLEDLMRENAALKAKLAIV